MIDSVRIDVGREAVVVTADRVLDVVSSAIVGGGFGRARTIVNLHVPKDSCPANAEVIAVTGRGTRRRFGGPISDLGWLVARAAREALGDGIRGRGRA